MFCALRGSPPPHPRPLCLFFLSLAKNACHHAHGNANNRGDAPHHGRAAEETCDAEHRHVDPHAAKDVAGQFVSGRKHDNIGLSLFAGESFTQCPLTIDYRSVLSLIGKSGFGYCLDGTLKDGTAIGLGIANAVSRLKDSKAKSKVIILLTDGSNNSGEITPEDAAKMAQAYGIRIYTIGFRTDEPVVQTPYGLLKNDEFDEKTLRTIATLTGGEYYHASTKKSLEDIYASIDQLERTKLQVRQFGNEEEKYLAFAMIALVSLLLEMVLRNTILKRIP